MLFHRWFWLWWILGYDVDAGVPSGRTIGSVAMGFLYKEGKLNFAVLTEFLGDEDHLGI